MWRKILQALATAPLSFRQGSPVSVFDLIEDCIQNWLPSVALLFQKISKISKVFFFLSFILRKEKILRLCRFERGEEPEGLGNAVKLRE